MTQFDRARSFGRHDGALRDLIHLFKYAGVRTLAPRFGDLLAQVMAENSDFRSSDVILPVPLHADRERARGYNQATLLAHELAGRIGLRMDAVSFVRVKATAPQAGLTSHQRRENVRAAFAVRGDSLSGLRVILVDDVFTTGATANACAHALRRAGVAEVRVLTVARVVRE